MIKREHIKQAIDAISRRNPEIGYSLDQMLGMGVIDTAAGEDDGDNLHFVFDDEKVLVNKVLFFNEGIVPIEQGLVLKYGELVRKQELQDRSESFNYRDASAEIHRAGLKLAVTYEIDYAVRRLRREVEDNASPAAESRQKQIQDLIASLEAMKRDERPVEIQEEDPAYFYKGVVGESTPAYFMKFPVSMDSLMQVADINMEFFHVRFVLNCLIRGLESNLMACVTGENIVGLIYLTLREQLFKKDLEIKYLASLRGKTWDPKGLSAKPVKGVGTFLVAGVWLLWKNEMPGLREVVLDAEVGARRFYEAVGFEPRGLSSYVLKTPKGYLLRSIVAMAHRCHTLREDVIQELSKAIVREVKRLRKKPRNQKDLSRRNAALSAVKECVKPETRPEISRAVFLALLKHYKKIPEFMALLPQEAPKEAIDHATSSGR
ncbi:MAG: hypothetical protein MUC98_13380 [Desulfobacterota bacterium]|nr:hypothetical protein [Thermodesulfobacteriota bacterium]